MAWDNSNLRMASPTQVLRESTAGVFMAGVYRWMFVGLALTAGIALYTATNSELFQFALRMRMPLFLVELGLVFGLSLVAHKLSGAVAGALFLAYAALNGLTFSIIFVAFPPITLFKVFFVTAGAFGAMALYGTVTKRDLSAWRQFLFIGLVGVLIASVVNIFLHSDAVGFVMSVGGVIVFGGLTAYDNQKLRRLHASGAYGGSTGSLSIVGALTLYLDFINLFLVLLRLFGGGRRRG